MKSKSSILKNVAYRTDEFQPNSKLDALIGTLRQRLEPVQKACNQKFSVPDYPFVGVVGNPRSGTTLLTQVLASTGKFCYPTNFLSRFAYAPYIGSLIQRMLFDPSYDLLEELSDIHSEVGYDSTIGKTKGALSINEFHHFWRRFFPVYDQKHLSADELNRVDIDGLRAEISSIQSVFKLPFLSKVKLMESDLSFFAGHLPELFTVYITREPRFVMQSLLLARRKLYGRDDIWAGSFPRQYEKLMKLDSYHQIAGQVIFTEKGIERQFELLGESRKYTCRYEELCNDTERVYSLLGSKLEKFGVTLGGYDGPSRFSCANNDRLENSEIQRLEDAYYKLKDTSLPLESQPD